MKNKKISVAVLFGGKSVEHEVSIQSAKNVVASLDKSKYDVTLIGIDKKGEWHMLEEVKHIMQDGEGSLVTALGKKFIDHLDVIFPVLHGPYGEDGSMQGFLQLANIPYVGSNVLGSAIGMDKDVTKRLLHEAGLPIGDFVVVRKNDEVTFEEMTQKFGLPFFVKPANLGSSVGVKKVSEKKSFDEAIAEAFSYDTKVLIEQYIPGKEIECAILGNENPVASIAGEIVASHEFYDYDAKYLDEDGAVLKIPAEISIDKMKEVRQLAIKTFQTLCLEGMARIDFFMTPDEKFYINEANTIPGFTNISMYPKLWEASGILHKELVEKLVALAIERHKKQQRLKTSFLP